MKIVVSKFRSNGTVVLRRVHLLELVDSSLQSVLHHVTQVKVRLSNFGVSHLKDGFGVLQGKPVTFKTFEGLGPSDEGLDIFWVNLQDHCAIRNDSVEVGDLLVACCDDHQKLNKK